MWVTALLIALIGLVLLDYWLVTRTLWDTTLTSSVLILIFLVNAFYFTLRGYKSLRGLGKVWGWFLGIVSFSLSGIVALFLLLQLAIIAFGGATYLLTSESPDKQYKIDFYYFDAGAMGTFGVRAELDGPLWFKKNMYYERHATEAKIEWLDNETAVINGNRLNLKEGESFGYNKSR